MESSHIYRIDTDRHFVTQPSLDSMFTSGDDIYLKLPYCSFD
jgi:hypothetical protein